jgi:hypothetical protein
MDIKSGQAAGYNRTAYLAFDLTRATSATSATLRLNGGNEGTPPAAR